MRRNNNNNNSIRSLYVSSSSFGLFADICVVGLGAVFPLLHNSCNTLVASARCPTNWSLNSVLVDEDEPPCDALDGFSLQ